MFTYGTKEAWNILRENTGLRANSGFERKKGK